MAWIGVASKRRLLQGRCSSFENGIFLCDYYLAMNVGQHDLHYMSSPGHDSTPPAPDGAPDPLRRIAELERRVAVLTRENERLETFLAILRHKTFGRSSEKMSPDQLSLLDTAAPTPADPRAAAPPGEGTNRQTPRGGGGRGPPPG